MNEYAANEAGPVLDRGPLMRQTVLYTALALPLLAGVVIGIINLYIPLLIACAIFGTAASFLGRAVLAAQRNDSDDGRRGAKSFFYGAGLVEGTETIAAFVLFCLFPQVFPWLAGVFAILCFWTAGARVVDAHRRVSQDVI